MCERERERERERDREREKETEKERKREKEGGREGGRESHSHGDRRIPDLLFLPVFCIFQKLVKLFLFLRNVLSPRPLAVTQLTFAAVLSRIEVMGNFRC